MYIKKPFEDMWVKQQKTTSVITSFEIIDKYTSKPMISPLMSHVK